MGLATICPGRHSPDKCPRAAGHPDQMSSWQYVFLTHKLIFQIFVNHKKATKPLKSTKNYQKNQNTKIRQISISVLKISISVLKILISVLKISISALKLSISGLNIALGWFYSPTYPDNLSSWQNVQGRPLGKYVAQKFPDEMSSWRNVSKIWPDKMSSWQNV